MYVNDDCLHVFCDDCTILVMYISGKVRVKIPRTLASQSAIEHENQPANQRTSSDRHTFCILKANNLNPK